MLLLEILKWSFRGAGWRPCSQLPPYHLLHKRTEKDTRFTTDSNLTITPSKLIADHQKLYRPAVIIVIKRRNLECQVLSTLWAYFARNVRPRSLGISDLGFAIWAVVIFSGCSSQDMSLVRELHSSNIQKTTTLRWDRSRSKYKDNNARNQRYGS